jgi:hypothetical protein
MRVGVLAVVLALTFIACGGDEPAGPPHAIASVGPTAAGATPITLEDEWYWMVRISDAGSTAEAIAVLGDELDDAWQEVEVGDTESMSSAAPSWSRTSFVRPPDDGRRLVWWVGSVADYQARMPGAAPFSVDQVDEAGEDGAEVLVVQQGSIAS